MISSVQKVVSATRVAREIEQKHDKTPSTASREIVHLAIQPNLSVDVNFRKLQWIDGGGAGGAVTIQFVKLGRMQPELTSYPILFHFQSSNFRSEGTRHVHDSELANRRIEIVRRAY